MNSFYLRINFLLLLIFYSSYALGKTENNNYRIDTQQLKAATSGAQIVQIEAVSKAVNHWMLDPKQQLVLQHSSQTETAKLARALKNWLIALGIDQNAIKLKPQQQATELAIVIYPSAENKPQ